jgi:hypothetical protein
MRSIGACSVMMRRSFGTTSRMLLSDEPVMVHCPMESHSAKWWRRASARFSSTVCGVGSPVSRASSGQKRFCGWP